MTNNIPPIVKELAAHAKGNPIAWRLPEPDTDDKVVIVFEDGRKLSFSAEDYQNIQAEARAKAKAEKQAKAKEEKAEK